jgi:hypothetical protein
MGNVIVTKFITLDGVMEAPHEWSFPYWNDEIATYKWDELLATDAHLLGRITYEGFAAARHCLKALWRVGLAGEEQRQLWLVWKAAIMNASRKRTVL